MKPFPVYISTIPQLKEKKYWLYNEFPLAKWNKRMCFSHTPLGPGKGSTKGWHFLLVHHIWLYPHPPTKSFPVVLYVNFITLLIKKVSSNLLWGIQFYTVVKSKVPSDWFWGIQYYTAIKKNFLPICFGVTQYLFIYVLVKKKISSNLLWGIQFYTVIKKKFILTWFEEYNFITAPI